MPNSLVSITQRVDGEVINATKYNGDRQQIVDALHPSTIEDYETDVTQSNVQTDPGEPGGEDLAQNLGSMFERLKFRIAEITGASLWRTTYVTRKSIALSVISQTTENTMWTPTGTTIWNIRFRVPEGFLAGSDITLHLLRRFAVAGGTAIMRYAFSRYRDATAVVTSGDGTIDFVHVDGLTHLLTIPLLQATVTYQLGDILLVGVRREGDDVGDTNTGVIGLDGAWIDYTGVGGR